MVPFKMSFHESSLCQWFGIIINTFLFLNFKVSQSIGKKEYIFLVQKQKQQRGFMGL